VSFSTHLKQNCIKMFSLSCSKRSYSSSASYVITEETSTESGEIRFSYNNGLQAKQRVTVKKYNKSASNLIMSRKDMVTNDLLRKLIRRFTRTCRFDDCKGSTGKGVNAMFGCLPYSLIFLVVIVPHFLNLCVRLSTPQTHKFRKWGTITTKKINEYGRQPNIALTPFPVEPLQSSNLHVRVNLLINFRSKSFVTISFLDMIKLLALLLYFLTVTLCLACKPLL
jgi:hypothetical protein